MTERRSAARFVLVPPADAVVRSIQDVVLERLERRKVVIVSPTPGVHGARRTIHVNLGARGLRTLVGETWRTQPVVANGVLRHRVTLGIAEDAVGGPADWEAGDVLSCLAVRAVPTRLLNISARGCLLESASVELYAGAIGVLDVELQDGHHVEAFRVSRAAVQARARPSRLGVELLPIEPFGPSIFQLIAQLNDHVPAQPGEVRG